MARHVWSVLCSKASVDNTNNTVSLFEVLEEIQGELLIAHDSPVPAETPIASVNLTLVSLWERSNLDTPEARESFRIRLLNPQKKEISTNEVVFSMAGPHTRSRIIINVIFALSMSGRYEFKILGRKGKSWREVALLPLNATMKMRQVAAPVAAS